MQEQTVEVRRRVAASPGTERRVAVRHVCKRRRPIRIVTRPSFLVRSAVVVDVSVCGLGLVLQERLEPGTIMAIQLQGRHAGISRILSGRIVHATPQTDGSWRIGCALSGRLSEGELQTLLGEDP